MVCCPTAHSCGALTLSRQHALFLSAVHLAFSKEKIRSTECIVSWDRKRCRNNAKYDSGFLKIRRKSDWRTTAAVIPTYFVLEFNMNRRIRNKAMERPKYGTSCVPGRLKPGRGTQRLKYGTSWEIRDGWQAYAVDDSRQNEGTYDFGCLCKVSCQSCEVAEDERNKVGVNLA